MPEENIPIHSARDNSKLYISGAILLGALIIGISLIIGLSAKSAGDTYAAQPTQKLNTTKQAIEAAIVKNRTPAFIDTANIKPGDARFIGKKNAPLTMYYWFDYQCPFCKAVEVGGVPQIKVEPSIPTLVEKYVNTGKLKIVFRDYAFLGQDSITAAEYSRAVWDLYPASFFAWQSAMFDAQDTEGDQGFGDAQTIETLTSLIPGIDVNKVKARVASNKTEYDAAIAADQKAGAAKGIQGTPGFAIGSKMIDGAQPLSVFTAAIDAQLK